MNILKFNFKPAVFSIKGKDYKIKPSYVDLILSFIVDRIIYTEESVNGYVDIPAITFKKLYDNYWVYICYLIEIGVIERKPYSVQNHNCYGYRFCYHFIKDLQIAEVELNDPGVQTNDCKEIPIEDQAFVDYKIIQRLKSDFQSAEIDTTNIDRVKIENTAYVDAKKFFYNVIQLYKWNTGGEHIYFQLKSNRLYNNFTFLSSHYRLSNVKLNNEPIVEFDISSSFPLMLILYCVKVNPDIIYDYDFKEYCTSIKNRTFYQDLTDSLNKTKDCNSNLCESATAKRTFTKDIVKKLFQIFINGDSGRTAFVAGYSNSFIKEQFALKYPCIYEIIESVKSNNEQIYYKLSKIETEFIVNIIEELYDTFPDIKILTCHDAIYLPLSFAEKGKQVWDSHLETLLNNLPDNIDKYDSDSGVMKDFGMYEDEENYQTKKKDLFNDFDFGDNEIEDDFDWFYN